MKRLTSRKMIIVGFVVLVMTLSWYFLKPEPRIDFSTQVKPILNTKCITCHGGVKAKAGFSVLFKEEALAATESGKPAIIPGNAAASEMIHRIKHNDPEERMPYKHEPLSQKDIDILEKWIDQGAAWGDHWAYLPVKKVTIPEIDNGNVINDVDKFILSKLEQEKLVQSPPASKEVLLRRVSLDLIGTLPSEELAQQYLGNSNNGAYEILVDSLLASPQFGERWASMWLDIARYADTKGYEADIGRNIWKYRDWVIKAFNNNKPYNEFITEQIAGDLLPNPTDAQYIATAFHRNSMTNDEGGTDNEEFRTAAVLDRVNTTWESLMSTTFACVQCHSHPYDPFKHDEYYKFMAYFNNSRDEDTGGDLPLLREFNDTSKQDITALTQWVKNNASEEEATKVNLLVRTLQPALYSASADSLKNAIIENNNNVLRLGNNAIVRYKKVNLNDAGRLIYHYYSSSNTGIIRLHMDTPDGPVFATAKIEGDDKWKTAIADFPPQKGVHDVYISYSNPVPPQYGQFNVVFEWFAFASQLPAKDAEGYEAKDQLFKKLLLEETNGIPVMVENGTSMQRKSNVFERGNWRSKGKEVSADVPATLKFAMPANAPKNRMGLAMWLTDKKNPLVARTMVNRLWEQLFGNGIVETLEDMGTQGINPTHRELLDHLSLKFMNEFNWSTKKLLKEMVMSYTYRQDSKIDEQVNQKDPYNKLYTHGPRIRLSAEQLRDQHLNISGTLSAKMYGPGVMPWQPDGIWVSPYNDARWKTDTGYNHYRRAVYTYWKRSSPYPSMIAFDGAQREVCNARRIRTNTPLQALVTLNDSVYVDLARHFAKRMQKEGGNTPGEQITKGYQLMLYKKITPAKLNIFLALFNKAHKEFENDPGQMKKLAGKDNEKAGAAETAMIVVANSMLNLDEVVMKN